MLEIDFIKQVPCPWSRRQIIKIVQSAAKIDDKISGGLEISIIDDRAMRKLNRDYRGVDRTTDVLAFAWREEKSFPNDDYLGQIYISYPRIKRQAGKLEVDIKEEFFRILAHGLLHLVGYDHQDEKMAKKMFARQEKIVAKILADV